MYQPPAFREDDPAILRAFVVAHPLGLLVSNGPAGLLANPIPFLLYDEGPHGVLRCHVSRANPQWQALRDRPEVLVVFQGSEHYITPSWYAEKQATGKVVPTWNYEIVEMRGQAHIMDDPAWLLANVGALTAAHEARRPAPWAVADAPDAFVAAQLKGIVGIEIPVTAIAGKFKASQNRPVADRQGVVEGLAAEPGPHAAAMHRLVKTRNGL